MAIRMPATTRILIADDHPLFREALRYVIDRVFPKSHIIEASGYPAALSLTRDGAYFDIVFVDLMMPGGSESLDDLAKLRAQIPSTPIVVISSREDWPIIRRVLALGVSGYIPKSAPSAEMEKASRSPRAKPPSSNISRAAVRTARSHTTCASKRSR